MEVGGGGGGLQIWVSDFNTVPFQKGGIIREITA